MNLKFLSGLATAAFLFATLAVPPSYANPSRESNRNSEVTGTVAGSAAPGEGVSFPDADSPVGVPTQATPRHRAVSTPGTPVAVAVPAAAASANPSSASAATVATANQGTIPESQSISSQSESIASTASPSEAIKVGEYQAHDQQQERPIAVIQAHPMNGRQAATLYVRNIPVLTFLSGAPSSEPANTAEVKVASVQGVPDSLGSAMVPTSVPNLAKVDSESDPVWRATAIAAQLNQLYRDNVDAQSIKAAWDEQQQEYVIKIGDNALTEINDTTILPDTTRNQAEDVLQATNRLRRQLGSAPPLTSIEGQPRRTNQVSLGPIQLTITGMASWYGPGFNGNPSASGEVFNENALTAAHRTLPFGSRVRVTNLDTGLSVVVRINDRGPFCGDRVIDLSTGAARVIGLVQSGVAPVSLDVLGTVTATNPAQQ